MFHLLYYKEGYIFVRGLNMAYDIRTAKLWSWKDDRQVKQEKKRIQKIKTKLNRMERLCDIILEENGKLTY